MFRKIPPSSTTDSLLRFDQALPVDAGWITQIMTGIAMFWARLRWQHELGRAISALAELDDKMLHDIGVSRSEIEFAIRNGRNSGVIKHRLVRVADNTGIDDDRER